MKDQIIKCQDCGQEFAWTIGEQQFYQQKGLKAPTRCPICRATYKTAVQDNFRGKVNKQG